MRHQYRLHGMVEVGIEGDGHLSYFNLLFPAQCESGCVVVHGRSPCIGGTPWPIEAVDHIRRAIERERLMELHRQVASLRAAFRQPEGKGVDPGTLRWSLHQALGNRSIHL